jgi:hypothetical protein
MIKYKQDNMKKQKDITTLDEIHKKHMRVFETNRNQIKSKEDKLMKLKEELNEMNNIQKGEVFSVEFLENRSRLEIEISKLIRDIDDTNNNVSELNYYSQIDDILIQYYGDNNSSSDSSSNPDKTSNHSNSECVMIPSNVAMKANKRKSRKKVPTQNTKNIITYFTQRVPSETSSENIGVNNKHNNNNVNPNPKVREQKTVLYSQYNKIINNDNITRRSIATKFCDKCKQERILVQSEGIYVCNTCGEVENVLVESDIPNYKDSVTEKPTFPYKRLNHFLEWLNQFQAKESVDIPEDIYDKIIVEVRRMRIRSYEDLTILEMKTILKKLRLRQYYEHIQHIICKITGHQPPILNRETEDVIKQMFKEIQEPFERHKPKGRTNFLSYSYVLHKFCQILRLYEFVKQFPLLKSREKLRLLDDLWRKICDDLGWEFVPST